MTYILAVLIAGACLGAAMMIGVMAVLMAVHDVHEHQRRMEEEKWETEADRC